MYSFIFINLDIFLDFQMLFCFLNADAAFLILMLFSYLISPLLLIALQRNQNVSISFNFLLLSCILLPLLSFVLIIIDLLWLILSPSLSPSSLCLSVFSCCFIWLKKLTSSAKSMFSYAVGKVQCIPRFCSVTSSSTSEYPIIT